MQVLLQIELISQVNLTLQELHNLQQQKLAIKLFNVIYIYILFVAQCSVTVASEH